MSGRLKSKIKSLLQRTSLAPGSAIVEKWAPECLFVNVLESHGRKAIEVIASILDIFRTREYATLGIMCGDHDDNFHHEIVCPGSILLNKTPSGPYELKDVSRWSHYHKRPIQPSIYYKLAKVYYQLRVKIEKVKILKEYFDCDILFGFIYGLAQG